MGSGNCKVTFSTPTHTNSTHIHRTCLLPQPSKKKLCHTYVMAGQDDVTHARCTIENGIVAGVGHTVGRMQRDWHVRRVVLRMWPVMRIWSLLLKLIKAEGVIRVQKQSIIKRE